MTRAGITDAAEEPRSTTTPVTSPAAHTSPAAPGPGRTATAVDSSGISKRAYALWLLAALVVGAAIRAFFSAGDSIVSADETAYLTSGLNLWSGHGFTTLAGTGEVHFPPALPFLLGGMHELIGGDPHTSTLVVGVITTTLVALPVAGITRMIVGRRGALIAAWIATLSGALVAIPLASGVSSGPYTLFVATALWLGLRASTLRRRHELLSAVGAGVLVGAAYLTRPEGLFFTVVLVPLLALPALGGWRGLRHATAAGWRRALLLVAAFLVPLALCVAPYVAFLHDKTGTWELTTKTEGTTLKAWRGVASDNRQVAHAILYRPTADFRFRHFEQLTTLIRKDVPAYLAIVNVNIGHVWRSTWNAALTPYPHWALLPGVLLLLAVFAVWRRRHDRTVLALLAAIAIPILTTIAFFVLPRYLVPAAALGCVLIAVGLFELPAKWFRLATIATLFLVVTSTGAALHGASDGWFHLYSYPDHKEAGEWIRHHSRPDDLIMSTNIVPGYYAQRRTVPVPWAQPPGIIDFARHYGVRYLVADEAHGTRFRPQLKKILNDGPWPGLRAVHHFRVDHRRTVIYEVDPRPAPFHGRVPLLDLGESN